MTKLWKAVHHKENLPLKSFMVKKILLDPARRDRAQADKKGTWMEIMTGPLKKFAKLEKWDNDWFNYEKRLKLFYKDVTGEEV